MLHSSDSSLSAVISQMYDSRMHPAEKDETVLNLVKRECKRFRTIYIFVDAIDECPPDNNVRASLLSSLSNFESSAGPPQVLVTSRPSVHPREHFSNCHVLQIAAQPKDVKLYARVKLSSLNRCV